MLKYILFGAVLVLLISCETKSKRKESSSTYSKEIKIKSIELEQVPIPTVKTSFQGILDIIEGRIHYIDRKFGIVYQFNADGALLDEFLGYGDGPYELNTPYIDGYLQLKDGDHLFLGSSFDLHIHSNENFERVRSYTLGWEGEQNQQKVRSSSNPDVDQFALYTLDYENLKLREGVEGKIYLPIYGETQHFNGLISDFYYEEGRILARLDLESGKVEEVLGRRSPQYLQNKYLPHHVSFSYDIDSMNNFYISHEIDSLIYKYDQNFELISAFGVAGSNMDTDYTTMKDFDPKLFKKLYFKERPKLGWYSSLEIMDELGLLFRSYTKGVHSEFDGLQIFDGETLIADLRVPKGFSVKGYINPYVYGEVVLEDSEELKLYRFEL